MSKIMEISPTFFLHKKIHERTWASPNGIVFNQIFGILINGKFASGIRDVRSYCTILALYKSWTNCSIIGLSDEQLALTQEILYLIRVK
jgi:hypothetical protein